jgi:hypothetical protein
MKSSFKPLFVASLTAFVLAGFALAPAAEAARAGGGGGASARSGGGGARASSSGGAGSRQVNNTNRDARTNNVRNTSVNNVNVNRNVNVDVDSHGGCCNNGWDNDYHPVAAAAVVVGTAAIIGSMVRTVPANCVPVNYGGMIYQQCGSTWYQPQGSQYMVVNPPY